MKRIKTGLNPNDEHCILKSELISAISPQKYFNLIIWLILLVLCANFDIWSWLFLGLKVDLSKVWCYDTIPSLISRGWRPTVGQNQGTQYLNQITLWKWTNLGSKYWINFNTRSPYQTKEGQILTLSFHPMFIIFEDFQYKTLRYFLCIQIALTQSIFELKKCFFSCVSNSMNLKFTNSQTRKLT